MSKEPLLKTALLCRHFYRSQVIPGRACPAKAALLSGSTVPLYRKPASV